MTVDAVVVGAGVAGLTAAHTLAEAGLRPLVLEAGAEVGGLVSRGRVAGHDVDLGAESFALRRPEVAALAARLGLEVETPATGSSVWAPGPDGAERAVRVPARTLLGVPADPLADDVVAVLGADAARRAAQDRTLDPAVGAEATTLAELVTARMGPAVLERLVRPVAGGIHNADPADLAVDAVAPGLRTALRAHGSLADAVAATIPAGPAVGCVVGGMWRLPAALVAALAGEVRTGARVTAVAAERDGAWMVHVAGAPPVRTDRLVLATSGPEALELLAGPLPGPVPVLRPGTPVLHVTLAVHAPALDAAPVGSGLLVAPGSTAVRAKALTHATAKWAWLDRATPPGVHLLRLSYGRPGEEPGRTVDADGARREAATLLGTPLAPGQVLDARLVRRDRGVPASAAADPALVPLLDRVRAARGLAVCGAWVAGTGLAAVVPHAQAEARRVTGAREMRRHVLRTARQKKEVTAVSEKVRRTSQEMRGNVPRNAPRVADVDILGRPAHTGPVTPLRLGTRASTLALTQSTIVAEALGAVSGREVELVRIRTEGDRNRAPLASLGGAGVFAAALRQALLDGECDLAVHSLKDLPTAPTPGLTVGALPERADVRDVLCAREGWTLATLPAGARVGTGSPRRAAQLLAARPDLEVVDIRGNVETRLSRVRPGDLDAVVLARAGLTRVGRLDAVTDTLDPEVVLPAPGQGALAVECRTSDLEDPAHPLASGLPALDDLATRLAVTAERAVLRTLEAGCAAPLGALARLQDGRLHLHAAVVEPDGSRRLEHRAAAAVPPSRAVAVAAAAALGTEVATTLLEEGAASITGRSA